MYRIWNDRNGIYFKLPIQPIRKIWKQLIINKSPLPAPF